MQFYPGKYKLEFLEFINNAGVKADITDLFLELDVNSSVASFSNSIVFSISDAQDAISELKIRGGDKLKFAMSYGSQGATTFEYVIKKVSNINYVNTQKVYNIECVSELSYRSSLQKISKAYSGKTSEIAEEVYKDSNTTESIGIWESSMNSETLIIPDWNPIYTLMWLAKRSKSSHSTRMKFFQDSKMRYNFTSLENIVAQSRNQAEVTTYTFAKNVQESADNLLSIDDVNFHNAYNNFKLNANGYFKGESSNFDIFLKKSSTVNYNRIDENTELQSLEKYPITERLPFNGVGRKIDSISQSAIQGEGKNKVFDTSNIKLSNFHDENQSITIKVKGNEFVDIGQVIKVEIPKFAPKKDFDMIDHDWSGRYVIIGKRDIFKPSEHVMYLQLSKDSLEAASKS